MLEKIKAITEAFVTQRASEIGVDPAKINAETDVFKSGLVDSMAFIDLVTKIETETGCELDFAVVDPDALNTLSSLVNELAGAAEREAA